MQLQFLGTGSGLPSKERNVAALALKMLAERGEIWLFDCGEATQHAILRTTIRPSKITKIFITHLHGDHIFGLLGLLCSRSFQGGASALSVYGPVGIRQFIETGLAVSASYLTYPLDIIELAQEGVAFADAGIGVHYRTLKHGVQSYGYRIIESEQTGGLQADKLRDLGIPQGPLWGKLKQGQTIELPDGRLIHGQDYLAPAQKGREVVIFGDTQFALEHVDFCRDADVLVHEATFGKEAADLARQYGHATCVEAAELARLAQVKCLYLTHISARYHGQAAQLEHDARQIFAASYLVHDLLEVAITR